MNPSDTATPPPLPTPPGATAPDAGSWGPMTGPPTLGNTLDHLLKRPAALVHTLHNEPSGRLLKWLGLSSLVGLSLFGLVLGFFSGGMQFWAAPLKMVIGVSASALLTWPSLCVFCYLNGLDLPLRTISGILVAAIALLSLLLLALGPVAWIFSTSTDSVPFMGFLVLAFWLVGLYFGLALIFQTAHLLGMKRRHHLVAWSVIFLLVTLQMSTTLRPLLGKSDHFCTGEKKFFLNHWLEQCEAQSGTTPGRGWH